jgi:ATP-dependent DNA helicase HFM1/MER3
MRIVALSATLPNISDVGRWLRCGPSSVHYFDDRFRPVPLQVLCFGYDYRGNQFLFEKSLDSYLKELIITYSHGKQTIIFCASKKGTQSCALYLKNRINLSHGLASDSLVRYACSQLQDKTLAELIPSGYAYHHAGLPPDDRMIIEQLFLQGKIKVLCSTSTLAHGINLPAHLVIVKGTFAWRGSTKGYERLKRSDVIQMLGRAGRPGFDTEGIAVIMTSTQEQQYYSSVALHADVVESNLKLILPEG